MHRGYMDNDFILILYLQQGLPHQRQDDLRYIDEMLRQNLIDHMKRNVGNFLLCLLHVNLFGILRVSQRFLRLGIGIQDCLFFFFLSLRYSLGMTSGKAFIVTGLDMLPSVEANYSAGSVLLSRRLAPTNSHNMVTDTERMAVQGAVSGPGPRPTRAG